MSGEMTGAHGEGALSEAASAVETEGGLAEPPVQVLAESADTAVAIEPPAPEQPADAPDVGAEPPPAESPLDAPAPADAAEPPARDERDEARDLLKMHAAPDQQAKYESLRESLFEAAATKDFGTEEHGVVLWNGGGPAKEAAEQTAAERTVDGDRAITLGETGTGQRMEKISRQMQTMLGPMDRSVCDKIYTALEQPAWTVGSQGVVESATGRVDVIVATYRPDAQVGQERSSNPRSSRHGTRTRSPKSGSIRSRWTAARRCATLPGGS